MQFPKTLIPILLSSLFVAYGEKKQKKVTIEPPTSFTLNCAACHMLDKVQVGPSLIEIAEIYPKSKREKFIEWCLKPGKKRPQMPAMPAMAHVPKDDLIEIYDYVRKVTAGMEGKRMPRAKNDPFPDTKRPRIVRSFFPDTGPASLAVALPTDKLHNIIWDTDECRLRYISEGEVDNWPYLRSNGNSVAKVGKVIYKEDSPLFGSPETQFLGYKLSESGLPTLIYSIEGKTLTESISVKGGQVVRTIKGDLPEFNTPINSTKTTSPIIERTENSITITYPSL